MVAVDGVAERTNFVAFRDDPSLCCTRIACCLVCAPVFACTFALAEVRAARLVVVTEQCSWEDT